LARCVLNPTFARGLAFAALVLCGCRNGERRPTPLAAPSVSASSSRYAGGAREAHFQVELTRARATWKSEPSLGECSVALHEKDDLELCQAARNALAVLTRDPEAPLERALPALENGALSLARLSKRLRYLSLGELSKKRLAGDAGAPTLPAAPPARGPLPGPSNRLREHGQRGAFVLNDGPISQAMATSVRLERDTLRNLGAYLEYAELPARRSAFATAKRLHEQHPEWPLLARLLREAALLETDPDLKSQLAALSASAQPSEAHPAQPGESK
jgi:hypothetical protein